MDISRVIGIGIITIILLFMVFTVPGEKGLVNTYHLHQQLLKLQEKNMLLQEENERLAIKASLLKKDKPYIEHTIMKELNMVRPGEIVIIFKQRKK